MLNGLLAELFLSDAALLGGLGLRFSRGIDILFLCLVQIRLRLSSVIRGLNCIPLGTCHSRMPHNFMYKACFMAAIGTCDDGLLGAAFVDLAVAAAAGTLGDVSYVASGNDMCRVGCNSGP